jgi:hypothetical protein
METDRGAIVNLGVRLSRRRLNPAEVRIGLSSLNPKLFAIAPSRVLGTIDAPF